MSEEISKQSFILMLGRGICFLVNIITPLFLVRYFTTLEYGEYRQMILILTSFSALLPLGFINSIFYFFPNYPDQKGVFLTRTIIFLLLTTVIFIFVFVVYNKPITTFMKNEQMLNYYLPLALTVTMFILSIIIETVLVVDNNVKLSTQIMTYTQILRMAIIIGCGIWGGVRYIVYGLLFLFTLKTIGSFIYFRFKYHISIFSAHIFKSYEHVRYSLLLGLGGIFTSLAEIVDKYIVSNMLGLNVFAAYSVGCYELPFIAIVFGSIADIALPKVVSLKQINANDEVTRLWHYTIESSMLIGIPMYVAFFIFANQFITTLFTNNYVSAVPVFRIALFTVILEATRYGMITRAYARTGFMFIVAIISLLLMIGCCYWGINHYGMVGAISAVIASRFFMVTVEIIYTKFILSVDWRKLLPFSFITKIFFLSLLSIIPPYIFTQCMPAINKWVILFGILSLYIVTYAIITNIYKLWTPGQLPLPLKAKYVLGLIFPYKG